MLISEAVAADGPAITVSLPGSPVVPKFTEAQLEYVNSWIKEKAPECPRDVAAAATQRFLEELEVRHPEKLGILVTPDFPARDFDSILLRYVGAQLTAAPQATLREEIARRRIQAVMGTEAATATVGSRDAKGLFEKIKDMSSVYYRRLVEGRMDDDDLILVLKKARQPDAAPIAAAPAKPKTLTAGEIVSEFARRNQVGSALQRLRACTIEGRLKSAAGEEQQLLLFRMRPDRFRLVVLSGGSTRYILAFDGERYWQQVPGRAPQELKRELLGGRTYLGEFSDPLFAEEGASYERLDDGVLDGQKFYRLSVRRPDASQYVACIDPATFRQIARENPDKSIAHYSDFREAGGITIAFREELTDREGQKGVFEITRVTPNPGLIQAFFESAPPGKPDYFDLERMRAPVPVTVVKSVR